MDFVLARLSVYSLASLVESPHLLFSVTAFSVYRCCCAVRKIHNLCRDQVQNLAPEQTTHTGSIYNNREIRKIRKTSQFARQLARILFGKRPNKYLYRTICLRAAKKVAFSSGAPKLKRT